MFITKKHIPRRAFLRGAGVALALPLLDSMIPAQTPLARSGVLPKTRFTGIFVPHGMAPGYWIPGGGGAGEPLPSADGKIVWDFDTAKEFKTVNGVAGHGGAIDVAGPVAAGGLLFTVSGYPARGGMGGNVLLAFALEP